MDPRDCSDENLLTIVTSLVGSHRNITAKLVACLAEIEERRLHLAAGFSSMFDYCTSGLGMSEGEAFRRILAARLTRRFPVLHAHLASGALNLSALELLRDHLTEENHAELLEAAAGRSKREVQLLVATRFPRPDVPSRVRASRLEPLSEDRVRVEFTISAEVAEKLALCRNLLRHANPTGDLAVVVERAVVLLLADLQTKRLAELQRPSPPVGPKTAATKGIPRAVRRQVFARDGQRCAYVSPDGRRCSARTLLELDHIHPRALGGDHHPDNLRVLCRAHNQLHAEHTFGRAHLEEHRHLRQQKCSRSPTWEKVIDALKRLGFREADARRAVAVARGTHGELLSVESALRHTLRALAKTPAVTRPPPKLVA